MQAVTGMEIMMVSIKDRRNQNLMHLIKRAHGLVESNDLEKQRHSQEALGSIVSISKDFTHDELDVDGVHCEWVRPTRAHIKKYVILHCHGGGYSTGSTIYARTLTTKFASATSFEVLSFDYRLAPEHPYPAALEDATKVWNYLMLQGYAAENVIVTGDSAGGNLALVLLLSLKEQGRKLPAGVVLLSPWTDLTSSGDSFRTKAEVDPVLTVEYIERMIEAYAPGQDVKEPLISPLYGDYTGFPPVCVQVGVNEILLSDSERLVEVMKQAGVQVNYDRYRGMWHVFQMSPVKAAKESIDRCAEFIYKVLEL